MLATAGTFINNGIGADLQISSASAKPMFMNDRERRCLGSHFLDRIGFRRSGAEDASWRHMQATLGSLYLRWSKLRTLGWGNFGSNRFLQLLGQRIFRIRFQRVIDWKRFL